MSRIKTMKQLYKEDVCIPNLKGDITFFRSILLIHDKKSKKSTSMYSKIV